MRKRDGEGAGGQAPDETTAAMTKGEKQTLPRRIHSLAAIGPLSLFLVFHLWQNWAALQGREAWLDRTLRIKALFGFELLFVLCLSLGLHIALGWGRDAGARAVQPGTPGLRLLQRLTGLSIPIFLAVHLFQVWLHKYGDQIFCNGSYDAVRFALGSPLQVGVYAAGVSVVYFHLAHGLSRAAVSWGLAKNRRQLLVARYLTGAFGFILWALTLHVLGRFALGHGLFG